MGNIFKLSENVTFIHIRFSCRLTSESQQPQPQTVTQVPFTPNYHPRSNSIIPHHSPFQYHLQHSASSPVYPPQPGFRPAFLQQWQNVGFGQPRGFKLPMPLPGQNQSPPSVPVSKVLFSVSFKK